MTGREEWEGSGGDCGKADLISFRIGSKGSGWLIDSFVQQGLQFEASGGTLRRHTRDNILVAGGSVSLPVAL